MKFKHMLNKTEDYIDYPWIHWQASEVVNSMPIPLVPSRFFVWTV